MPDVYADIAAADRNTLGESGWYPGTEGCDPQQVAMRMSYQSEIELGRERCCWSGLRNWPRVGVALAQLRTDCQVFGVDPSPFFLTTARRLAEGIANLQFRRVTRAVALRSRYVRRPGLSHHPLPRTCP